MRSIENALARIIRVLTLTAGWALLAISIAVTFSSLTRKFIGISIQGIDEYAGYALAFAGAIGFSYGLLERGHIRIDVIRNALGRRGKIALDVIALASILFAAVVIAAAAIQVVMGSAALQAVSVGPLQTPLIVPQGVWAGFLVVFAALCVVMMLDCAVALRKGDSGLILRKFGVKTADEEVSSEVKAVQERQVEGGGGTQ